MRTANFAVIVLLLFFVGSALGQERANQKAPNSVDMQDRIRMEGWKSALDVISNLESADQEQYPGICKFAVDIRKVEQSIDSTKPPHEWRAFDADTLVYGNPNFWRAIYEMAPGDAAINVLHTGLLVASGEIMQAQIVLQLLEHDTELANADRIRLSSLERLIGNMVAVLTVRDRNQLFQNNFSAAIRMSPEWWKEIYLTERASDEVLLKFSRNCQSNGADTYRMHELALVARQIVIARRGRYDDQDKQFIETSLRELVPGAQTDETIKRLLLANQNWFAIRPRERPISLNVHEVTKLKVKNFDYANAPNHSVYFRNAAFSPDGSQLVSDSRDNLLNMYDATNGEALYALTGTASFGGIESWVKFSLDGERLAVRHAGTIRAWKSSDGQELLESKVGRVSAFDFAVSETGDLLASAASDVSMRVMEASSGLELLKIKEFQRCLCFSPNGKRLASGGTALPGRNELVRVWDIENGQELMAVEGHSHIHQIVYSPDSKRLAWAEGLLSATASPAILKIADASNGQLLYTFSGHTDRVLSVVFSPDGKWLASRSLDKTVKIWDTMSGEAKYTFRGYSFLSIVFSPDNSRLLSFSSNGTIRAWELTTSIQNNP